MLSDWRLLWHYLYERFLWRVARSGHRNDFVLKGGLRMIGAGFTWARTTKDIDFLGHGDLGLMRLEAVFCDGSPFTHHWNPAAGRWQATEEH